MAQAAWRSVCCWGSPSPRSTAGATSRDGLRSRRTRRPDHFLSVAPAGERRRYRVGLSESFHGKRVSPGNSADRSVEGELCRPSWNRNFIRSHRLTLEFPGETLDHHFAASQIELGIQTCSTAALIIAVASIVSVPPSPQYSDITRRNPVGHLLKEESLIETCSTPGKSRDFPWIKLGAAPVLHPSAPSPKRGAEG